MTGGAVLTAAHVVRDATSVLVRFVTEDGRTTELPGRPVREHGEADIAVLKIANDAGIGGLSTAGLSPVRFARVKRVADCEALGFPRFKLRRDTASPERYRDSHHAFLPAAYHPRRTGPTSDRGTGRHRRRRYDLRRAEYWLGHLAGHLDRLSRQVERESHDLAWWELGTTLPRSTRTFVIGFLAGLAFGGTRQAHGKVRPRFMIGLGGGLVVALLLVLVDRGVVGPLGLADGQGGGFWATFMFLAEVSLGAGLVFGLMAWLETPVPPKSTVRPSDLLARTAGTRSSTCSPGYAYSGRGRDHRGDRARSAARP